MIKSIRIKNLATIEDVELKFEKGFSILTGETGSGKSIIIDGLRLVLGEKSSSDIIRTGKSETSAEAVFQIDQQNMEELKDSNLDSDKDFFIQRKIFEKGSGKGYINGILSPVKRLKQISTNIVDVYGQNDHTFLRNVENQLDYIDLYSDSLPLRKEVSSLAQDLKRIIKEKSNLESNKKEKEQRIDFLNFQIKEIEKAQLKPNEEEELRNERNILKNSEKINLLTDDALNISYNQENSISSHLSKLKNIVTELLKYDPSLKETKESIDEFQITINEFSNYLINIKQTQSVSPDRLEIIERRLSEIENLKRKYGNSINEILSFHQQAKKDLNELSQSEERLEDLEIEIDRVFQEYKEKAETLSEIRKISSKELEQKIEDEIKLLGMKKAKFKIDIHTTSPSLHSIETIKKSGTEEAEFLINPNPGDELKPLRKIASGGELSRIMLALKSVGKKKEFLKTMIFDEIDSGIGGKTAEFVAQKLKALSKHHQVICISHLPQIASYAAHHYKIDKKVDKGYTFTIIKKLNYEERVQEIARLIAGSHITSTSIQNAREMLEHNLKENNQD
ncbi:MAG: DNA repair protein RecN [Candidatus Aminicenantaceae bacterium]